MDSPETCPRAESCGMFLPTALIGPKVYGVRKKEGPMKRALVCVALLLVGSTALAETPEGYERFILSIAPSYALCARFSRYDTRLHIYNDAGKETTSICY